MRVDDRFLVRSYRRGDEEAILQLFRRSFPHAPRTAEHFRWKYLENPFASRRISLTFDPALNLVAHYAGYGVPFYLEDRSWIANQIGDTMTDVSIRHIGRGPSSILGRTALHFYEEFCEGRVAFNFGFNVSNIQKFSLRFLRSTRVEPVPFRFLDLNEHPLTPVSRRERLLAGYQLAQVRETSAEWDELFVRAAPRYGFCVRRDASWIRWRYLRCPDTPYVVVAIRKWRRLVGWVVYRVHGSRLLLGDAFFHHEFPDAPAVLLRHIVPQLPVDRIEGWFPGRPRWFDQVLEELGFRHAAEPQNLSLMCVPFRLTDAVERMRGQLYYTMGDGDLF